MFEFTLCCFGNQTLLMTFAVCLEFFKKIQLLQYKM